MESWSSWMLVKTRQSLILDRYYLFNVNVGCEYHGYTSDMTRCWPVNGQFTDYQKQAYEVVLDVQLDLIKFCRERPPLDQLFQRMCRLLGKNLQEIGFGSPSSSCVEKAQVRVRTIIPAQL